MTKETKDIGRAGDELAECGAQAALKPRQARTGDLRRLLDAASLVDGQRHLYRPKIVRPSALGGFTVALAHAGLDARDTAPDVRDRERSADTQRSDLGHRT